jgi:hypothetical protein
MTDDEIKTKGQFLGLERAEWRFWSRWVLASAVGWSVGWAMGWPLPGAEAWAIGVRFAIAGAVVGTAQRIVLRKRVYWSSGWVLASAVAVAVGETMGFAVSVAMDSAGAFAGAVGVGVSLVIAVAVSGAVVGTAQWIVLRKRVYGSSWWVLASAAAVAVGKTVGWAVSVAMGLSETMYFGVIGVVGGAITGLVLIKLLRQPIPEAQEPQQEEIVDLSSMDTQSPRHDQRKEHESISASVVISNLLTGVVVGPTVCCVGILFLGAYTNRNMHYILAICSAAIGAMISARRARGSDPIVGAMIGAVVSYGCFFLTPFLLYMMGLISQ